MTKRLASATQTISINLVALADALSHHLSCQQRVTKGTENMNKSKYLVTAPKTPGGVRVRLNAYGYNTIAEALKAGRDHCFLVSWMRESDVHIELDSGRLVMRMHAGLGG